MRDEGGGAEVPGAVLLDRLDAMEREVDWLRAGGARLGRSLYERSRRDLGSVEQALALSESRREALEKRLTAARRRTQQAEARAATAERRLEQAMASPTWRIGRVVMAGPRALRRRLRRS